MSLLTPGQTLNAASLNSALGDLRSTLNALSLSDLAPNALSEEHLPGMLSDFIGRTTGGLTGGYRHTEAGVSPEELYENYLPPNNTHPTDFTAVNVSGGAPWGPASGLVAGWRVPAWGNDSDLAAKVSFTGANGLPDLTTRGLRGIRTRFSVELGEGETLIEDMLGSDRHKIGFAVAIGWCDTDDDFWVIKRSVRFYSVPAFALGTVNTFTTVRQSDITGVGTAKIKHIVGYIGWKHLQTTTSITAGNVIAAYNLSCLPLFAGELS